MDVLKNIEQAITLLKEVDDYNDQLNGLNGLISVCDQKIDYWEHFLELEPLNIAYVYKICEEIKKQRILRRKYKNDAELIKVFKNNEQKMSNSQYRDILMTQINTTNSKQQNAKYSYDAYTNDEALEILGIKKKEGNE